MEDDTIITGPLYESQKKVYPQAVHGTFRNIKWGLLVFCLSVYYLMPFLRWDRGPALPNQAVLIDLPHRRFYFFFISLWPQEVYFFTGLLILAALTLFLLNSLAGRIWCGYFCWQTVWTDLFYEVERWVEGDRRERMKKDKEGWTARHIYEFALKNFLWLLIAMCTGGAWVLYFADAPTLLKQIVTFQAPYYAYLWMGILTFTTFLFAGYMREQTCIYMCPWPRIQAALTDEWALNVSYESERGEPRMSVKKAQAARAKGLPAGDCVDCHQCVAVCPTGVDIRHGSQLGCIQCGLCIDACDHVMKEIGRPPRLIKYDTDINIKRQSEGLPPIYRPVRPRTMLYAALIAAVGGLMLYVLLTRTSMILTAQHGRNPVFVMLSDGRVRNDYTVHISNKTGYPRQVALSVQGVPNATITSAGGEQLVDGKLMVEVVPDDVRELELFVAAPPDKISGSSTPLKIIIEDVKSGETTSLTDTFITSTDG